MHWFRDIKIAALLALLGTPLLILSVSCAAAQVMQSTNYRIQQDSINFSGGLSTSTNYTLESTAGEVGTGDRSSASYKLRGGYQQLDSSYIAISSVADVALTPSIPGITGGTSNGSTTVTVTTDSPAGYTLSVSASQSPALRSAADTISDYVPAGANPDFTFTTSATDAHFGFSPSGSDIVARFKDNGTSCNVGSGDIALACWDGLSTSSKMVAQSAGPNVPGGTQTALYFKVGIGGSVGQASGTYTATTTVTALTL